MRKHLMKKHIIFMVSAYLLASNAMPMQRKIVMRIYPDEKLAAYLHPVTCKFVQATLEGFKKEDVNMQSVEKNSFAVEGDQNSNANKFRQGKAKAYPLVMHKGLNCEMTIYDSLEILICDQNGKTQQTIQLSHHESFHILTYLQKGLSQAYHDCLHAAAWMKFGEQGLGNMVIPRFKAAVWQKITSCCRSIPDDEVSIPDTIPAGAIIIFCDRYGTIHHNAMALNNELCLSKMGWGGPFMVARIDELCEIDNCSYVKVLID